jgi:xanthine dehydrogenase iron-sulfur cluster and FAD-binding subunit A
VLVSRCVDRDSGEVEHRTVNGCLVSLCSIDGCHVITVEGLSSMSKLNFHPIQSRLAEVSGSQCGFCTPGMVMTLYGIVTSKSNTLPTMQDIEEGFDGNLCRCTGYRPILDTAKTFATDIDKLPSKKSSTLTSTTFDKCISYPKQSSLSVDRFEFRKKLQDYIPKSIHIIGSTLLDLYIITLMIL